MSKRYQIDWMEQTYPDPGFPRGIHIQYTNSLDDDAQPCNASIRIFNMVMEDEE